jgi:hypothetical protein
MKLEPWHQMSSWILAAFDNMIVVVETSTVLRRDFPIVVGYKITDGELAAHTVGKHVGIMEGTVLFVLGTKRDVRQNLHQQVCLRKCLLCKAHK